MTNKPPSEWGSEEIAARTYGKERINRRPPPECREIKRLLAKSATREMTSEAIRDQRISFAYGQLMEAQPEITKQQIAAVHDEIYGKSLDERSPDERFRNAEGSGPWLHNPKRPAPASAKWWPIGIGVFLAALGLALLVGGGQ